MREAHEYARGHVPGAVLICAGGTRSAQAAAYLAGQGRRGLMNLMGGTSGWMREGRDLVPGDRP